MKVRLAALAALAVARPRGCGGGGGGGSSSGDAAQCRAGRRDRLRDDRHRRVVGAGFERAEDPRQVPDQGPSGEAASGVDHPERRRFRRAHVVRRFRGRYRRPQGERPAQGGRVREAERREGVRRATRQELHEAHDDERLDGVRRRASRPRRSDGQRMRRASPTTRRIRRRRSPFLRTATRSRASTHPRRVRRRRSARRRTASGRPPALSARSPQRSGSPVR